MKQKAKTKISMTAVSGFIILKDSLVILDYVSESDYIIVEYERSNGVKEYAMTDKANIELIET